MTFAEISEKTAHARRVPKGQLRSASIVAGSAEGSPNKDVGITVRAPNRVTSAQTAMVRHARQRSTA